LEESGFDAYGVDSSEEGVIRACAYLAQRGCEARALVHASCTKLIFEANTFDLVVDCQTIQHLSENDHGKAYAEVARVLKPFGRFWTMHYAEGDAKEIYAGQYPELRRWRLSELGGLIEEAGLQEVSVELLQRGNVRKSQSIVWWVMSFVKTGGQR
jgi:ubiquinone/menaquinone biosynthesis C-methylase UbiE